MSLPYVILGGGVSWEKELLQGFCPVVGVCVAGPLEKADAPTIARRVQTHVCAHGLHAGQEEPW